MADGTRLYVCLTSVLLLGLASTIYPIYLCKVWNLRTKQPIRQKGPYLLLISQFSGYLCICLVLVPLIVKCISNSDDSKPLNKPICYVGGVALLFLHPLFYLPYLLRYALLIPGVFVYVCSIVLRSVSSANSEFCIISDRDI